MQMTCFILVALKTVSTFFPIEMVVMAASPHFALCLICLQKSVKRITLEQILMCWVTLKDFYFKQGSGIKSFVTCLRIKCNNTYISKR